MRAEQRFTQLENNLKLSDATKTMVTRARRGLKDRLSKCQRPSLKKAVQCDTKESLMMYRLVIKMYEIYLWPVSSDDVVTSF